MTNENKFSYPNPMHENAKNGKSLDKTNQPNGKLIPNHEHYRNATGAFRNEQRGFNPKSFASDTPETKEQTPQKTNVPKNPQLTQLNQSKGDTL
ncbi:MAG: hypothetical protein SFT91_03090 [Rickettsiaceae bacterium]|nr:hypothetical protein [Rickettsiaceae bacterium]